MENRNILIYYSLVTGGDWDKTFAMIEEKAPYPSEEEVLRMIHQQKCQIVTMFDEDYPQYFMEKGFFKLPFVLYYYGDISLIKDDDKNIAVVGSRKCTEYGEKMTRELVEGVSDKLNIVSGLAKGIDSCAHHACINKKGKTIAVLGGGIDYIYPPESADLYFEIKEKGLLISEHPGNIPPKSEDFPFRNRLIIGFSRAVLIPQGCKRSGTQISASFATMTNKEVLCVPTQAGEDSLTNNLIKAGAYLVENVQDVFDALTRATNPTEFGS